MEEFAENHTGGNRRIEVCRARLLQARRSIVTASHRELCHALVVEAEFAKVAILVIFCVIEIHIIVARTAGSECGGVHILEAVEVAVEHELLACHLSLIAACLLILGTEEDVEVVVLGKCALVGGKELSSKLLAA